MVVGDDKLHPERAAERGLVVGRNSAVDCHDQLHILLPQAMQRHLVQAVALFEAGRDIAHDVRALPAQEVRQQAGRGDAVDVIVAEDADLLPPVDCAADAPRRLVHVQKRERVGQRLVRRQKVPRFV